MGGLVTLILTALLPAYFGFTNASPVYTAMAAIASTLFGVIISGRREPGGSLAKSLIWGSSQPQCAPWGMSLAMARTFWRASAALS